MPQHALFDRSLPDSVGFTGKQSRGVEKIRAISWLL